MSFNIVLQTNTSENNKLDKTLTDVVTLTGSLKAQTSIVNPIILCDASISSISNANYMTISDFGRSYFITDIVSVSSAMVEIHARCDVLSSFKTEIRANKAILKRSENTWNLYVDDGTFRTYQNPNIATIPFTSGFSGSSFVLAVAGS